VLPVRYLWVAGTACGVLELENRSWIISSEIESGILQGRLRNFGCGQDVELQRLVVVSSPPGLPLGGKGLQLLVPRTALKHVVFVVVPSVSSDEGRVQGNIFTRGYFRRLFGVQGKSRVAVMSFCGFCRG
jgi:hypothetical protein